MPPNVVIVESSKGAEEHPHFKTRLGLILSCLGCVIGTGNIWRFPRIVANNSDEEGGLVFILIWIMFLFLWSIPMVLLEYGTGRFTKKAVIGSFRHFLSEKAAWCGAWISMVTFFISSYYSVVLGWCFYYVYQSIAHELPAEVDDSRNIFTDFAQNSSWPVLTHAMALLITGFSDIKGVNTIEKVNMFLVPFLLLIVIFTFIWSLTRQYAERGIQFLFTPHWDSFTTPRVWVDAISQNAYDTGAGMGLFIPYSTFMTAENGIVKYGTFIPTINNMVSLTCAMMLFSTVFSTLLISDPNITQAGIVDVLKDSGPANTGLTFIWVPVLFSTLGVFGRVLAVLFFLCLSVAGITSLISNMELLTHTLFDFGVKRKYGMPITVVLVFCCGLPSALNLDVLTNQDFVWGFALLVNGMMLQAMVIMYGTSRFRHDAFNNYSIGDWKLPVLWEWIVKVVAPLEATAIIIWWAYDLIGGETNNGEKWYEFGTETFMMTIVQWAGLMTLVVSINMMVLFCKSQDYESEETVFLLQDGKPADSAITYDTIEDSGKYADPSKSNQESFNESIKVSFENAT